MPDELIQGRRETNEIIPAISHTVIRVTNNHVDIPLSDPIMANITQSLTIESNNHVYLPGPTTIVSGISHEITIINDV